MKTKKKHKLHICIAGLNPYVKGGFFYNTDCIFTNVVKKNNKYFYLRMYRILDIFIYTYIQYFCITVNRFKV